MVGAKSSGTQFGDTTYTKIFVGGLPWETQRDTMKHYFEQFGEILEAVVITEKTTGRSKGYGFVTFKDPESALRACQNPNPVIDGRIANCNLAVLGAQKDHPKVAGLMKKSRAYYSSSNMATSPFLHTSAYFHQHNNPQYAFPYSAYGYPSSFYPQDSFTMNYYNGYGGHGQGQQSHYAIGSSPPGPGGAYYYYYYPLYAEPQRGESESHRPTTTSIPKVMIQHPYPYYPCIPLGPHQNRSDSVGSLPLPTSVSTGTPTSASQNNISL